jgi:transcriptional regulator with XRE-family HTH domain
VSEDVPPELVALGAAIRRVRRRRKMTREELAEASDVHLTTLKEIENATISRERRPETFPDIADALGVTLEYLYDLANNRATLDKIEDPTRRMLREIRQEFGEKFSVLEELLRQADADRTRQYNDLAGRFDALHPEVNVHIGGHEHGEDTPEK